MFALLQVTTVVLLAGPSPTPAPRDQTRPADRKKVMTAQVSSDEPERPLDVLAHLLPGDAAQDIRSAETIEILRLGRAVADEDGPAQWAQDLQHRAAPSAKPGLQSGSDAWPVLARFSIPAQRARGVTQRLLVSQVRTGGGHKLCGPFRPGVAVRFHHGAQVVEALLCFHCDDLALHYGDEVEVYDIHEDAVLPLVAVAREVFPEDAGLRETEAWKKKLAAKRPTNNDATPATAHSADASAPAAKKQPAPRP